MSAARDPRAEALREVVRLAREDRRRGIHHWFDPDLPDLLRELVREVGGGGQASSRGGGQASTRGGGAASTRGSGAASTRGGGQSSPRGGGAAPPRGGGPTSRATASRPAPPAPDALRPPRSAPVPERTDTRTPWAPPPAAEGRAEDWEARLAQVAAEASACKACDLCRTRQNVVFGTGAARVPLVLIGEAPGADEDAQGIPFVGRSGQLLTKIIEAIGLDRRDVYICNVVKCRPPQNRNPAPDEIARCAPLLARQLEILKPKAICTLGLIATQAVLSTAEPIGKLRGRVFTRDGYRILPTYHPAALLRNPSLKVTVWEDVQLLRKILDE